MTDKSKIALGSAILVAVVLCADQLGDGWGKPSGGMQVRLHCDRQTISPSAPGQLILEVRNVGDMARKYHLESCCGPTLNILASWSDGASLSFTMMGSRTHPCRKQMYWIEVPPRQTKRHTFAGTVDTFAKKPALIVGGLASPLDREGTLSVKIKVRETESNAIKLIVRRGDQ